MPFTRAWDGTYKNTPANTDLASEGAVQVRQLKEDLEERLWRDHGRGEVLDGKEGHKHVSFITNYGVLVTPAEEAGDAGILFVRQGVLYFKPNGANAYALGAAAAEEGGEVGVQEPRQNYNYVTALRRGSSADDGWIDLAATTISPRTAAKKIKVDVVATLRETSDPVHYNLRVLRNITEIIGPVIRGPVTNDESFSSFYVDEPQTTSLVSYKWQMLVASGLSSSQKNQFAASHRGIFVSEVSDSSS